jgi:hypothetical protein
MISLTSLLNRIERALKSALGENLIMSRFRSRGLAAGYWKSL